MDWEIIFGKLLGYFLCGARGPVKLRSYSPTDWLIWPQKLLERSPTSPLFFSSLQAMDLEVPVLARNIPGNAAVVKHEVTGLLFSDPQVKEGNFPMFTWSE